MSRVAITCRQMRAVLDQVSPPLLEAGFELHLPPLAPQAFGAKEMGEILAGCSGLICGDDEVTADVIEAAEDLRSVVKWGIGTDSVDQSALSRRGVRFSNTPAMFGDEVADVAIGYLIMLARGLHRIDAAVRTGFWFKPEGRSLSSMRVGIVGLGAIGSALAERTLALGMTTRATDPASEAAARAGRLGIELVGKDILFSECDAIVLTAPATPETVHIVNRETLGKLPPGSLLVNVSRGSLVDESALVAALSEGNLGGAALDVFESEPLDATNSLTSLEMLILGSHNASNTTQANLRASHEAVRRLIELQSGD